MANFDATYIHPNGRRYKAELFLGVGAINLIIREMPKPFRKLPMQVLDVAINQHTNTCHLFIKTSMRGTIEVVGQDFYNQYNLYLPRKRNLNLINRLYLQYGARFVVSGVLGLLAMLYVTGWVIIPFLAEESAVRMIDTQQERDLGKHLLDGYLSGTEPDSNLTNIANAYFKALKFPLEEPIKIFVVNDPTIVNGFALPGYNMVIYTGIIELMDDQSQLAGLLAHECAHICERHPLRSMANNLSKEFTLNMLLGNAGGFQSILLENASSLDQMHYSRNREREADLIGLELLRRAHIKQSGLANLFNKILNDDSESNWLQRITSTHPDTHERIEYLNKNADPDAYDKHKHVRLNGLFRRLKNEIKKSTIEE